MACTSPALVNRVELWPLARLVIPENNPRTHSAEQIDQIARSYVEFGMNNPVLVDTEGRIVVGTARFLAAQKLEMVELPVIVVEHLSEIQKRAYRLADNQLALNATWNEDLLRQELEALVEAACSVDLLGFAEAELARLLASPELQKTYSDEDAVPEVERSIVSAEGDLWTMDDHRLLCGDATDSQCLERVMAQTHAAMTFTDPPYNVAYRQQAKGSRAIMNDNLGSDFKAFLEASCRSLLAITAGAIYICMASSELHTLERAFLAAGGHFSTFLIWVKDHFTLGRSDYHRQYEPILYGWREGAAHHWCGDRKQSDVWSFARPRVSDLHPTMKPVALIEQAIRNSSPDGAVVLDPFAGSGATLIACQKTGRRARLVELDAPYVDVIVRRWQDFTGREATLESDGRTFAAVAQERGAQQTAVREAA